MANLSQIAESLNVSINLTKGQQTNSQSNPNKPEGQKRRDWITEKQPPATPTNTQEKIFATTEGKPCIATLSLKDLRSNPLKVAQYIFELSQNEPTNTTNNITRTEIMNCLNLSKDSVKTATRFLLRNYLMERIDFRPGKTGWSKFKITTNLYHELKFAYENKLLTPQKIEAKLDSTLKKEADWNNIDIESLESIGLNKKHLLQLKHKNEPIVVQESIFHFAYGLKFNPKIKNYENPLSVLIGVLRKGEAWIEANYRSAQEIAQEKIIRTLQAQKERLEKLYEEAFSLAFSDWYSNLTTEATEAIVSSLNTHSIGTKNITPKKILLRTYFNQNIWPTKKWEYVSNPTI